MSVGQEFWVVATGCQGGNSEKDQLLGQLGSLKPSKFEVPDGDRSLLFGSFDSLIRLTDDLLKFDAQVDSIVHRLERQFLEIEPNAVFKVKSQRQEKDFVDYLKGWQWDEAKYPKSRSISDNLTLLMSVVNKLDEEARNKTAQYNDFKSQKGNVSKKDAALLTGLDLVDVLTPAVVSCKGDETDDFIYTHHLTTVAVLISRGMEKDFLKCYESLAPTVVPQSAKCFKSLTDKEGNSVWRVVVFSSDADNFKRACRERRFVPRDFEFSVDGYKKLMEQRSQLEDSVKRQHDLVKGLYQAAWSDAMVAWVHIKAMRVFVESVLRFGMPPKFASYVVSPKANATVAARKTLASVLGKGQSHSDKKDDGEGDEEYFPYVSLTFTPFTAPRA